MFTLTYTRVSINAYIFFSAEATYMKFYASSRAHIFLADVYFEEFLNLKSNTCIKNKNSLTTFNSMMMLDHQELAFHTIVF